MSFCSVWTLQPGQTGLNSTLLWQKRKHLGILVDYHLHVIPSFIEGAQTFFVYLFLQIHHASYCQKHVTKNDFIATDCRQNRGKAT